MIPFGRTLRYDRFFLLLYYRYLIQKLSKSSGGSFEADFSSSRHLSPSFAI